MIVKRALIILSVLLLSIFSPAYAQMNWPSPVIDDNETRYADNLIKRGHYDKAISFLLEVYEVRKYKNHRRTVELLSEAMESAKKYDMLEQFAEEYRRDFPDSLAGYLMKARACFLTDRDQESREILNSAIEHLPDSTGKYRNIATEYLVNGIMEEAIETYKRGRRDLKDPLEFSLELASIYEAIGRYGDAASEYMLHAVQRTHNLLNSQRRIAMLMESTDETRGIIKSLEKTAAEYSGNKEAARLLSYSYQQAGLYRRALDSYIEFDRRYKQKGGDIVPFLNQCLQDRQYDIAIEGAEYIVDTYGSKSGHYWRCKSIIAASFEGKGKLEKAKILYTDLIDRAEDIRIKLDAHWHLGEMAFDNGDLTEAEAYYRELIDKFSAFPESDRARIRLGDIQLRSADFDSALAVYYDIKLTTDRSQEDELKYKIARAEFYRGDFSKAQLECMRYIFDYPSGRYANDCLILIDILKQAQDDTLTLERFALADYNIFVHDYTAVESVLTKILNTSFNSTLQQAAYLKLVHSQLAAGKIKPAVAMMESFEDRYPESYYIPFVLLELGNTYFKRLDKPEKAAEYYRRILNSFPESMVVDTAREKLRTLGLSDQI